MEAWMEALPEDLRSDPNISKFKTPADLAKSYVEASKMIGNSVRPPGPDATPEQRKEYIAKVLASAPELVVADDEEALYKRLGRPEKADEYTVDDSIAKGINLEAARAQAKAAGLTKKQFQALAKQTADAQAAANDASDKEHATLKQEWGFAHSDRVLAAAAVARKMGMSDALVAGIAAGKVPADQLRFFYQASKVAGVDAKEITAERSNNGGPPRLDPMEARAQIAEIQGNPVYWNKSLNPAMHEVLKDKMVKLTGLTLTE